MPRPYPPEFRQRALDLVCSGRSVPEVAGLLGIAESCLYRWKRQDLIDRGLKPRTGQAESAETHRSTAENPRPRGGKQDPPQGSGRGRAGGAPKRPVPPRGRAPR
jgi:transposase-like protein